MAEPARVSGWRSVAAAALLQRQQGGTCETTAGCHLPAAILRQERHHRLLRAAGLGDAHRAWRDPDPATWAKPARPAQGPLRRVGPGRHGARPEQVRHAAPLAGSPPAALSLRGVGHIASADDRRLDRPGAVAAVLPRPLSAFAAT